MFFWLTAFIIGFGQLVLGMFYFICFKNTNFFINQILAGVYARYYWDRERFGVPCSSLLASFFRAFVFHLGTIAFGSLIIAIVKLIRAILEYFEKKLKDKTGKIAGYIMCCCRCCLFCLEKFLKFLNRNAYIMTAIYGTGFITSARRAFSVIVSNPLRLLVIDKVCDFLIFLGKLCITLGIGILAFFFFTHRITHAEEYVPELHYYFIPLLLVVIGTYIVATCFFSVYSMAVDTLFICALEDLKLKEKNQAHQLMMSKELRKVFRVKKEKENF
jgi:choline transporter-like protein 2/4/5